MKKIIALTLMTILIISAVKLIHNPEQEKQIVHKTDPIIINIDEIETKIKSENKLLFTTKEFKDIKLTLTDKENENDLNYIETNIESSFKVNYYIDFKNIEVKLVENMVLLIIPNNAITYEIIEDVNSQEIHSYRYTLGIKNDFIGKDRESYAKQIRMKLLEGLNNSLANENKLDINSRAEESIKELVSKFVKENIIIEFN